MALGFDTAAVYWDIKKFYDSIDWVRAIDWSLDLGLPARLLRVAMSMHMAPRLIKIGKAVNRIGLVPKCQSAIRVVWHGPKRGADQLASMRPADGVNLRKQFTGI